MPIEVELPGGDIAEFPDGTAPDVMKKALSKYVVKAGPEKPRPSMLASGVEGAAQGLTFGFSDEIEGAVRAGVGKLTGDQRPIGDLYSEGVAVPRQRIKEHKEANPGTFLVGEIGGGVALPLGAARLGVRGAVSAASGRSMGARAVAGAKEGAAYGGLYGAGTAEGGASERLTGAGQGAVIGGAFGAAMPGVVDAAGAIGSRIAAPFRATANPRGVAAEKMGEAIARDNPVGGAERFASKFDDMAQVNPAARAMDAGGDNVRGLMRAANNMPNEARDEARRVVDARQGSQWNRIQTGLTDNMGEARGSGYFDELDRLAQQMDEIGAQRIRPTLSVETPMTPKLRDVLSRPTTIELQKSVERKLADEGLPIGLETRTAMLHRLKVELDDQIGMSVRAERMGNQPQAGMDTRTLTILKRDLMNAIDNPEYKDGLRTYANTAQIRNALEDGYDAFNKQQPEQLRSTLAGLDNDVQRDFYRFGALRAVVERVRQGNSNRDRTDSLFSSPEMQLKLREIFPSLKQFREFQRILVTEAKMADSRKALQGNSTTAKQLAEGDQAGKTASMISSAMNAAGGSAQAALNLVAQGYNRFTGLTPRVAAEIVKMGISRDPSAIDALVKQGVEQASRTPVKRAATAQRLISGTAAATSQPLQVTVYPQGDPRNNEVMMKALRSETQGR